MFGFNMFPPMMPRSFQSDYACFSIAMLPGNEREDVERGGKIIMPPSALEQLTRLNINYPMLFKLTNRGMDRITHCGVLEFVADEGKVYLPHWMMRNLMLNEGDSVIIENVSLPVATYSKFQPQSPEFLDISNPKAVLENCLRNFACLTTGDTINIKYNQKDYELFVIETQPGKAVTIIECDMNVEFASPVGYEESKDTGTNNEHEVMDDTPIESRGFLAFTGIGHRLDGKGKKPDDVSNGVVGCARRGIPDYDYESDSITFMRNIRPTKKQAVEVNEFKPFAGDGNILNPKKLSK